MEHPVLATDAEMDETRECENHPSYANRLEDDKDIEDDSASDVNGLDNISICKP